MKPSFLNHEKPLLTTMIQKHHMHEVIDTVEKTLAEGTDAFGVQTCKLLQEYRNADTYKEIFSHMQGKPVYVTNYRKVTNEGVSDEILADGLIEIAQAGGTLCDVMGDIFDKHPDELTVNPVAIDKQKRLIEKLHENGAEVLMSSHLYRFVPAERVVEIALAQQERGADIVKIVTGAQTDEEVVENLKIASLLKNEIKVPYLFLSTGESKILRRVGPRLGCCMYLCVYEHDEFSTKNQPVLRNLKAIIDNFED